MRNIDCQYSSFAHLGTRVQSLGQNRLSQNPHAFGMRMLAGLPEAGAVAAACIVPSTLGFWRSEYTVSYGYGTAMFASGLLLILAGATPLGMAHALVVCLYGIRLNAFLLYRELKIERFQKFVDKIEHRAKERIKWMPVQLFLYFLFVTVPIGTIVCKAVIKIVWYPIRTE